MLTLTEMARIKMQNTISQVTSQQTFKIHHVLHVLAAPYI